MRDPYSVLGIPPDADPLTVRRAYQKLARRWHPALRARDREAEERFQAAAQAYALLSDPEQRRRWDKGGRGALSKSRGVATRRRARLSTPGLAYSFEELVVELLPDDLPAPLEEDGGEPAVDIKSEVALGFAEAIHGVVVSLSVQRESLCRDCDGTSEDCSRCEGRGLEVDLERVRVRIPPGVGDGSRVRVRGQGNLIDGRRGDLYVTTRVRPHEHYRRQGDDLYSEIPITVREAALGAAVQVPTIHGPVTVQVPAGTRSGQRFRLAGRGVARNDEPPGDHYYRVEIVPPVASYGENRRLLDELEQEDPRQDLPWEEI
jgi:DnaJ-class molecular chaperone